VTRFLTPRLEILPQAQRELWPHFANVAKLGFVLYGGTAIALRLGHRQSVDFDFFSDRPLDQEALKLALPLLARSVSLQDSSSSWTLLASCRDAQEHQVKVSFFGPIGFGRVGEPDTTNDHVMQVASLADLMATKLKVVLQRAEAKDYRDIAAMLDAGASLAHGLAAARTLFGPNFQPSESLKALVFHGDGDLGTLTGSERETLITAAKAVRELPEVTLVSHNLVG
jgi:hypothetical protein